MINNIIYLDNNATTPLDERVLAAMMPYLSERYGNPSSIYSFSQKIKMEIEDARDKVKDIINADEKDKLIFTGGGSESDNLAIKGIAFANMNKGKHIITSSIEHHAVLNTCKYLEKFHGFEITYLPVDEGGIIDIDFLNKSIREDTILITVMYANNETGVIQPIEDIGSIAREKGVVFHTDAVQVAGKLTIDVKKLNVDLLTMSAHKFYGPKGVGALYVKKGTKIHPLIHGGGHEMGLRAGTENTAGIIGLSHAFELSYENIEQEQLREKKMRDRLEKEILNKIPDVIVNGNKDKRLPNTLNVIFKYVEGESILMLLDSEGICVSSGSACTSGSLEPSHVLLAMGRPHELAHGSIRFSFGRFNKEEDVDKVVKVLPGIVKRMRDMSPFGRGKDEFWKT